MPLPPRRDLGSTLTHPLLAHREQTNEIASTIQPECPRRQQNAGLRHRRPALRPSLQVMDHLCTDQPLEALTAKSLAPPRSRRVLRSSRTQLTAAIAGRGRRFGSCRRFSPSASVAPNPLRYHKEATHRLSTPSLYQSKDRGRRRKIHGGQLPRSLGSADQLSVALTLAHAAHCAHLLRSAGFREVPAQPVDMDFDRIRPDLPGGAVGADSPAGLWRQPARSAAAGVRVPRSRGPRRRLAYRRQGPATRPCRASKLPRRNGEADLSGGLQADPACGQNWMTVRSARTAELSTFLAGMLGLAMPPPGFVMY